MNKFLISQIVWLGITFHILELVSCLFQRRKLEKFLSAALYVKRVTRIAKRLRGARLCQGLFMICVAVISLEARKAQKLWKAQRISVSGALSAINVTMYSPCNVARSLREFLFPTCLCDQRHMELSGNQSQSFHFTPHPTERDGIYESIPFAWLYLSKQRKKPFAFETRKLIKLFLFLVPDMFLSPPFFSG